MRKPRHASRQGSARRPGSGSASGDGERRERSAILALGALLCALGIAPAHALDGGTLRVNTFNGWEAFEVITQGDDPSGDGFSYSMPGNFDGAGAWLVDPWTLRLQVNHEVSDASISEVDVDLADLRTAISNVIQTGNTGGVSFVLSARQAYGRWSSNGGASFISTSDVSNTSFARFCSSQAYAPDTFGTDRGFVDQLYVTGEEVTGGRLFALDSVGRDLYQLSGTVGSAPGGIGGMAFDRWENAALLDTSETAHVALLLSPDGGSEEMKLYIGEKDKDSSGNPSSGILARNGLAYGSWYYLNASLPSLGNTNVGSFDTTALGALSSSKLEDIDTSPSAPTRVVLGDQNSGVFTFDFDLVFSSAFSAGASSFTITKIANDVSGTNVLGSPDNVDWSGATKLGGTSYPDGLVFVNEDNSSGEIWRLEPDGSSPLRIGSTTVGEESSGIFDLSELVGYVPASILVTTNQGSPASMTVLIDPNATEAFCGNSFVDAGEQCDDGNTDGGDCCSPTCQFEAAGQGSPDCCVAGVCNLTAGCGALCFQMGTCQLGGVSGDKCLCQQ